MGGDCCCATGVHARQGMTCCGARAPTLALFQQVHIRTGNEKKKKKLWKEKRNVPLMVKIGEMASQIIPDCAISAGT